MNSRLAWWVVLAATILACDGKSTDDCSGCEAGAAGVQNAAGKGDGAGTSAAAAAGSGGTTAIGGSSGRGGVTAGGDAGKAGSAAAGTDGVAGSGGDDAAGESGHAGAAGASPVATCEPGQTRCLSQREVCSADGHWVQGPEWCTIALAGSNDWPAMCALRANGEVMCFGTGEAEPFGGDPLPVLPGAVSLSVTDDFNATAVLCVLMEDRKLRCRASTGGELVIENVQAAATGQMGVCFADGMAIRCEQAPRAEVPVLEAPIEAPGTFTKLVMGHQMLFALRDDGVLLQHGHLLGEFPDEPYIDVATSGVGACVVQGNGGVRCLPDMPVPEELEGAYRRIALEHHDNVCGIRREGSIACWTPGGAAGAYSAPEGQFTQIAATWNGMCAVRTDGTISCFGDASIPQIAVPDGW